MGRGTQGLGVTPPTTPRCGPRIPVWSAGPIACVCVGSCSAISCVRCPRFSKPLCLEHCNRVMTRRALGSARMIEVNHRQLHQRPSRAFDNTIFPAVRFPPPKCGASPIRVCHPDSPGPAIHLQGMPGSFKKLRQGRSLMAARDAGLSLPRPTPMQYWPD